MKIATLIGSTVMEYALSFRTAGDTTVALLDPIEGGRVQRAHRVTGVATYNPADFKAGLKQDREVGRVLALRRALEADCALPDEIEAGVRCYKIQQAAYAARK